MPTTRTFNSRPAINTPSRPFNFKGHTFTITEEEDHTFAFEVDNRYWSGGWAYRSSAFSAAQTRIIEIIATR